MGLFEHRGADRDLAREAAGARGQGYPADRRSQRSLHVNRAPPDQAAFLDGAGERVDAPGPGRRDHVHVPVEQDAGVLVAGADRADDVAQAVAHDLGVAQRAHRVLDDVGDRALVAGAGTHLD